MALSLDLLRSVPFDRYCDWIKTGMGIKAHVPFLTVYYIYMRQAVKLDVST